MVFGSYVEKRFQKKKRRGKVGKKKDVTDKIVLTAYIVWFITSAKDYHRYSSRQQIYNYIIHTYIQQINSTDYTTENYIHEITYIENTHLHTPCVYIHYPFQPCQLGHHSRDV